MKTNRVPLRHDLRALTRLEVVVIVSVITLVVLATLPPLLMAHAKKTRINCVNNLKHIGLAYRIWATDNMAGLPWHYDAPVGTKAASNDVAATWRHFYALSNELGAPRLLICPADRERRPARTWAEFNDNRFLSYALGFSATEEARDSILASDRNLLLDGSPLANAIVSFPSNANVTFDRRIHVEAGNVLIGDGSVQQVNSARLSAQFRDAFQATGTNVLVIP